MDMLKVEMEALCEEGFDLELTGIVLEEIGSLFADKFMDVEEDDVPEPPAEPRTKPGQIWIVGEHRLMCGDAIMPEDLAKLRDGQRADLWLTDPPYNVDYVGKTADALRIRNLTDCGRTTRPPLLWNGTRPSLLRCRSATMGGTGR